MLLTNKNEQIINRLVINQAILTYKVNSLTGNIKNLNAPISSTPCRTKFNHDATIATSDQAFAIVYIRSSTRDPRGA